MRATWNLAFVITAMICLQFCLGAQSQAQELKKALRDYRNDRVFNYQPTDPWYRGKLFNTHTGHYGKFYNCDGEESKRNSPYICWKPHHEKDFPTRYRISDVIRYDIDIVKRRVRAGACMPDCDCQQCQSAVVESSSCNCADCQSGTQTQPMQYLSETKTAPTNGSRASRHEVFTASNSPVVIDDGLANAKHTRSSQNLIARIAKQPATISQSNAPKFGLVSGKIVGALNNTSTQTHSTHRGTASRAVGTKRTANASTVPWYRQSSREAATAKDTLNSTEYFLNLKRR